MAEFIVTNNSNTGAGSLRDAIDQANANADADTITFDTTAPGWLSNTITLATELVLSNDLTINGDVDGDGTSDITISGDDATRVFAISGSTTDIVLQGLDIIEGRSGHGAAVLHDGDTLQILDRNLTDNHATTGGGAIFSVGNLSLVNSSFSANTARYGGAVQFKDSALYAVNSTFSDNTAANDGGAIFGYVNAAATLVNTTISGNDSTRWGGGIVFKSGVLTVHNSTIVDNEAVQAARGGGVYLYGSSTATFTNSVIASNVSGAAPDDVYLYQQGGITATATAHSSFFGTSVTLQPASTNNINNGGDPGLLPLADNGGPVQTHAIAPGSQLIAAGSASKLPGDNFDLDADSNLTESLPVDANGNARARGGLDIGAFESSFATGIVVDTESDLETIGTSLAADRLDGDGLSLREAIAWAGEGETITFDQSLDGNTITLTGVLALTRDVTIDGDVDGDGRPDITISGNNATRVFYIKNTLTSVTDVVLQSLDITQGYASDSGGAILHEGSSLEVRDSSISHSRAGGPFSSDGGGAIYVQGGGTTTIVNSSFISNKGGYGGAIGTSSPLYVIGSTFSGNEAYRGGGAIRALLSQTTLVNTTISGNTALRNAGIEALSGGLDVRNSTIVDNEASSLSSSSTGGVYVGVINATIINSVIANNLSGSATNDVKLDNLATVTAHSSFFGTSVTLELASTNNINGGGDPGLQPLADNGGPVFTHAIAPGSQLIAAGNAARLEADAQDIDNNSDTAEDLPLDAHGRDRAPGNVLDIGAVQFATGLTVTTDSDAGDDLTTTDFLTDLADGGGLSLREAIAHAITGETITFDTTAPGWSDDTITLGAELSLTRDVTIDGAGAVTISGDNSSRVFHINSAYGSEVNFNGLTLTEGLSTFGSGGAIYVGTYDTLRITNSTISNSTAAYNGGAIFSVGNLEITSSTITGNSALYDGGGIYSRGYLTVRSSTFSGNLAISNVAADPPNSILENYGEGGAIFADALAYIFDSTFTDNDAAKGGAIANKGDLHLFSSTLVDNSALISGGAVDASDLGDTFIVNTTMTRNDAKIGGAVAASSGGDVSIYNSTLYANGSSATTNGRAIDVNGGSSTAFIFNSIVASAPLAPANVDISMRGGGQVGAGDSFFSDIATGLALTDDFGGNLFAEDVGPAYLGPLQDNGGLVETMAPQAGSPLLGTGDVSELPDDDFDLDGDTIVNEPLPLDAAGNPRFEEGDDERLDIGAFQTPVNLVVTSDSDDDTIGNSHSIDMLDDGGLTLREAVAWAQDGDTINFDTNAMGYDAIYLNDVLVLDRDLTIDGDIDGDGRADIMISGGGNVQIFRVEDDANVELRGLYLTGGRSNGGGAIFTEANTTLTVVNSSLVGNYAYNRGGALYLNGGATIVNSTILYNYGSYTGGAIQLGSNQQLVLINTTLAFNGAEFYGGAIEAGIGSTVTAIQSTITRNYTYEGVGQGGGVFLRDGSTLHAHNSVISGNVNYQPGYASDIASYDGYGSAVVARHSLLGAIYEVDSQNLDFDTFTASNLYAHPTLGLGLASGNFGLLDYIAFIPRDGSPLIDAGDPTLVSLDDYDIDNDGDFGETLPFDSRGAPRMVGASVDIGANETLAFANDNDGDAVAEDGNLTTAGVASVLDNDFVVDTVVAYVEGIPFFLGNFALPGDEAQGRYGTLVMAPDGSWTYTLDNVLAQSIGSSGDTETFTYVAAQGFDLVDFAQIYIDIAGANDAPVAVDDTNTGDAVIEDGLYDNFDDLNSATGNVLANDTDIDVGDTSFVFLARAARGDDSSVTFGALGTIVGKYGTLTIDADGDYLYILDNTDPDTNALAVGQVAHDYFSYIVRDGGLMSDIGEIDIAITGANDAPEAIPDTLATTEDTPVTFTAAQLTGNDIDPDSIVNFSVSSVSNGTGGTVVLNPNGTVTFTPSANFNGAATFSYRVSDGTVASDNSATVTVNVAAVNDPTIINSNGGGVTAAIDVVENTTAVTTVTSTDLDGFPRTYSLAGGADQSRFQIDPITGILAFIAAPDFDEPADAGGNNVYDVIVRASEGGASDDQAIAVTVTNVLGNTITGGLLPDTIDGTTPTGNAATGEEDSIDGGGGSDTIFALGGNDTVRGGLGKDSMDGGAGRDTLDYSDKTKAVTVVLNGATFVTVKVGPAEDSVANFENVIGGTGADRLTGDGLNNLLQGGRGNDILNGAGGMDTLIGGVGNDKLNGGDGNDSIDGGIGNDAMTGGADADTLIGGDGNDKLDGGTGNDSLDGGAGRDVITGGAGADTLVAGSGTDTLTGDLRGGMERDVFVFNAAAITANAKRITDMTANVDVIHLDDAFFAAIGPTLEAGEFVSGAKATALDADDFLLYDTKTGILSYDADGNGAGKAVKIATLTNKPQLLDHEDFMIV